MGNLAEQRLHIRPSHRANNDLFLAGCQLGEYLIGELIGGHAI